MTAAACEMCCCNDAESRGTLEVSEVEGPNWFDVFAVLVGCDFDTVDSTTAGEAVTA